MYCRYCGKKTKDGVTVCDACSEQNHRKRNKYRHLNMILVALLLLVMVVAGIIFVLQGMQNRVETQICESIDALLVLREDDESDLGTQIANALVDSVSYEITEIQENTVIIVITAPDMNSLYKQILAGQTDEVPSSIDEYECLMNGVLLSVQEALQNKNYKLLTTEITVQFDDDGNVEKTYELIDALYGGLLTLQEELVSAYIGGADQ